MQPGSSLEIKAINNPRAISYDNISRAGGVGQFINGPRN